MSSVADCLASIACKGLVAQAKTSQRRLLHCRWKQQEYARVASHRSFARFDPDVLTTQWEAAVLCSYSVVFVLKFATSAGFRKVYATVLKASVIFCCFEGGSCRKQLGGPCWAAKQLSRSNQTFICLEMLEAKMLIAQDAKQA